MIEEGVVEVFVLAKVQLKGILAVGQWQDPVLHSRASRPYCWRLCSNKIVDRHLIDMENVRRRCISEIYRVCVSSQVRREGDEKMRKLGNLTRSRLVTGGSCYMTFIPCL